MRPAARRASHAALPRDEFQTGTVMTVRIVLRPEVPIPSAHREVLGKFPPDRAFGRPRALLPPLPLDFPWRVQQVVPSPPRHAQGQATSREPGGPFACHSPQSRLRFEPVMWAMGLLAPPSDVSLRSNESLRPFRQQDRGLIKSSPTYNKLQRASGGECKKRMPVHSELANGGITMLTWRIIHFGEELLSRRWAHVHGGSE